MKHTGPGWMIALLASMPAHAAEWTFQPPVTAIARDVGALHAWIMWIILAIFVLVFGVMFYAILRHRRSLGHEARHFHENTTVEILWTLIPLLILIGMAWPVAKVVLAQKDTRNPGLTIKVTGQQWLWQYDYLDHRVGFKSRLATPRTQINNYDGLPIQRSPRYLLEVDEPLVVPVDTKVRILTTSNDVIHSWGVPAFAVKQDAIPGYIRDTWFTATQTGTFRGQCVELCGRDHAFMPVVVKVVSKDEFSRWITQKQAEQQKVASDPNRVWTRAELMQHGEKVYKDNCASCHQENGKGLGPFPALTGSKIATGPITGHLAIVLKGKNAMPAWPSLSNEDIAAVVTYERNALGNKVGDELQPKAVAAARQ
ncbi:cytochrome c oxidase subunit II [Chitinilyticum litopenaei]|uniref:cytochrome c oxidase subunit II n=1 Tax=Chitinilyticum litopenaei TaxID=1121276 RepID=UPI000421938F|nr:cytochrome c oxidase subunit II [Chitinilyticum litopenaei]